MKLTIISTKKMVKVDGVQCRVWEGTTEDGTSCTVYVHIIGFPPDNKSEFEELNEQVPRVIKEVMP